MAATLEPLGLIPPEAPPGVESASTSFDEFVRIDTILEHVLRHHRAADDQSGAATAEASPAPGAASASASDAASASASASDAAAAAATEAASASAAVPPAAPDATTAGGAAAESGYRLIWRTEGGRRRLVRNPHFSPAAAEAAAAAASGRRNDQRSSERRLEAAPEASGRQENADAPDASTEPDTRHVCFACGRRIYRYELRTANRRRYHEDCFRCHTCNVWLRGRWGTARSPSSAPLLRAGTLERGARSEEHLYCVPHSRQVRMRYPTMQH